MRPARPLQRRVRLFQTYFAICSFQSFRYFSDNGSASFFSRYFPIILPREFGGPAQVVVNSIYFLIFIHIRNSVALNGKIMLFL